MNAILPLDARALMTFANADSAAIPIQPVAAPASITDTGLAPALLHALLAKHLLVHGDQTPTALAACMAVRPSIIGELVATLLDAGQIHVDAGGDGQLTVGLNSRGRGFACAARDYDGYVGPAPISAADYCRLVDANSRLAQPVTRAQLQHAFADVVIDDDLLDQLGHGLNAARPLLIHGPSGGGKTFLCEQLAKIFDGTTLIPYAIAIEDRCVALYDPALHDAIGDAAARPATGPVDARLLPCRRPALLVGAELRRSALGVTIDPASGIAHAPLTLQANNGLLIVEDVGHQRIPADELMRRLALAIDTQRDWIRIDGVLSAEVPFDARLILVTDLAPDDLGGDALRRQIAHRIPVGAISAASYAQIWRKTCENLGIPFDPALPEYALDALHGACGIAPLATHPAQLLRHMLEQARYTDSGTAMTVAMLDRAWTERVWPERAAAPPAPHHTH